MKYVRFVPKYVKTASRGKIRKVRTDIWTQVRKAKAETKKRTKHTQMGVIARLVTMNKQSYEVKRVRTIN